jgi:hypothetical protein
MAIVFEAEPSDRLSMKSYLCEKFVPQEIILLHGYSVVWGPFGTKTSEPVLPRLCSTVLHFSPFR